MALKDADARAKELQTRMRQAERERDEDRNVARAELKRLTAQLREAEQHIERLTLEIEAANERSARQHEADNREIGEVRQCMLALQTDKEASDGHCQAKIIELAETLRLAKEEIRRLDAELHQVRMPSIGHLL